MLELLFKIFTGPLFDRVSKLIIDLRSKDIDEAAVEAEVKKALLSMYAEVAKPQASVLIAEMQSDGWLQKNWRPLVALSFAGILVFYALVLPIAVGWLGLPPVRVGDTLLGWVMQIVSIAVGGYVGGSVVENVAKILKGK